MVLSRRRENKGSKDQRLGLPCGEGRLALIDSGAQLSLLDYDYLLAFQRTHHQVIPLRPARVRPRSLTGDVMSVAGRGIVTLPGLPRHDYLVVRQLPFPVLIGADFCHKYEVQIDFVGPRVRVGNKWLQAEFMESSPYNVLLIDKMYDKILAEFPEVFREDGQLGKASGVKMTLTTKGQPIRQRSYRLPLVKRNAVQNEVHKLLQMGIIQHSTSPWSSPVVVVPKKDGTHRLCIDYRKLNAVTEKDSHPLPNIRDIFDQLEGSSYFSLLDLVSGYHQVEMEPASREKTAFSCHLGHFEYTRMPFGLCNAPSVFQRYMNFVLRGLLGKGCLVYLDDIVIYGRTRAEHDDHLRQVLKRLREHKLRTKPAKCTIGERSLKLLGHVVDKNGIHTDPDKCKAIRRMEAPRDAAETRRFLGATGYYRDLIPGYAKLAAPLVELTRKDVPFEWTRHRRTAFEQLKKELLSDHCVGYPDVNKPYNLYTDACDYALGSVLTQKDDVTGKEKAIYYISHQFNDTQRRWPTIEKEAYGVVYSIDKLRPYLLGSPGVNVYTDHKPLLSLFTEQMKNTKIQRWAILLAEFKVKINYIKGENNFKADFLSRLRHEQMPETDIFLVDARLEHYPEGGAKIEHVPAMAVLEMDGIDMKELINKQKQHLTADQYADPDAMDLNGVLCSIKPPNKWAEERPRIILPEPYRKEVINRAHREVGHAAAARTLTRVREGYVWPGMNKDVAEALMHCPICLSHGTKKVKVTMGEGPLPALPDQVIALDLVGPFAYDEYRRQFAMTILDHCSGWVEAYPLRNKTNKEVLAVLRERYLPYHTTPYMIITDNGREFSSDEWREYLARSGIKHQLTTPYNPQSNGKVERMNRSMKEVLSRLCHNKVHQWSEYLPEVIKILNNVDTKATGYPPMLLQTGRSPRLPIQGNLEMDIGTDTGDTADFLTRAIRDAYETQRQLREENRRRINAKANAGRVDIGDSVMVWVETRGNNTSKWDPGYRVVRTSPRVVWVTNIKTGGRKVLHRSKVKVVDPDLVWDGLTPRPTRYQLRAAIRGPHLQTADPQIRAPEPENPQPSDEAGQQPARAPRRRRVGRPQGRPPRKRGRSEDQGDQQHVATPRLGRPRKILKRGSPKVRKRKRSAPTTPERDDPKRPREFTEHIPARSRHQVNPEPLTMQGQVTPRETANNGNLTRVSATRTMPVNPVVITMTDGAAPDDQENGRPSATTQYNLRPRRGRVRAPSAEPGGRTPEKRRHVVAPDTAHHSMGNDAATISDSNGTRNPSPSDSA